MSIKIAAEEKALKCNLFVLQLAALLHEMVDHKLMLASEEKGIEELQ